jgi:hypothetical protein
MTRFVAGKIEVTTPIVDGVQRYRIKDLGGIGGHRNTWLGDYFSEEALYARLAELGIDPATLEEMPSGFHRCPVDRHWGARGCGVPALDRLARPGVWPARQAQRGRPAAGHVELFRRRYRRGRIACAGR